MPSSVLPHMQASALVTTTERPSWGAHHQGELPGASTAKGAHQPGQVLGGVHEAYGEALEASVGPGSLHQKLGEDEGARGDGEAADEHGADALGRSGRARRRWRERRGLENAALAARFHPGVEFPLGQCGLLAQVHDDS